MSIRGLNMFISDIRNCNSKEQEKRRVEKEMAKIRHKFRAEKHLDSYQKKKYVWKLLYIYMLGYDMDFGHMEAVGLVSCQKYSEKQVGYLACALLLHEQHELITLIINTVRNDLSSKADAVQSLALCLIANIGGEQFGESVVSNIMKILYNQHARPPVKKKAALCLVKLYRKDPHVFENEDPAAFAMGLMDLLNEKNIGVQLSVLGLIMELMPSYTEVFQPMVPKAVSMLQNLIVGKEYTSDYLYYGIPCPWLQIKLLRVLQFYPATSDSSLAIQLSELLQRIIVNSNSADTRNNVNKSNALHSILVEAVTLVLHLDHDKDLLGQAISILGKFISSRETNIRYIGLEVMARVASLHECSPLLKKHHATIVYSLKDSDVSIRRRALDLLYEICDKTNVTEIVGELLDYLAVAEYNIKEELALKIAILAERFATRHSWYVVFILKLLSLGGEHVASDVWHRVIQITTNHEEIQRDAAKTVFKALKPSHVNENMLRVGAYILGEFGHRIAGDADSPPEAQFQAIHSKFFDANLDTKAMLLTSYIKFANAYPQLKDEIMSILRVNQECMDAEVQQRATEYIEMIRSPAVPQEVVREVLEMMPNFTERESLLLRRLHEQLTAAGDSRAKAAAQAAKAEVGVELFSGGDPNDPGPEASPSPAPETPAQPAAAPPVASPAQDLLGLDTPQPVAPLSSPSPSPDPAMQPPVAAPVPASDNLVDLLGGGVPPAVTPTPAQGSIGGVVAGVASSAIEKAFRYLCGNPEGVLYEDNEIQVGFKSEYSRSQGRVGLFFQNKTQSAMNGLVTKSNSPHVRIQFSQLSPLVTPGQSVSQQVMLECIQPFGESPELQVSYSSLSGQRDLKIKLPIVVSKFMVPVVVSEQEFFGRWNQIHGGPPLEQSSVFRGNKPYSREAVNSQVSKGLNLSLGEGIDKNPDNIVAAGMFCAASHETSCLVRLETSPTQNMFRLTVRTGNKDLTHGLSEAFVSVLDGTKV